MSARSPDFTDVRWLLVGLLAWLMVWPALGAHQPGIIAIHNNPNLRIIEQLAAIAHEGQHPLDYMNPKIRYPKDRATEHTTEMNAYRTEIGVARGLGVCNDLYAPGATAADINERINDAANTSTEVFCQSNGC